MDDVIIRIIGSTEKRKILKQLVVVVVMSSTAVVVLVMVGEFTGRQVGLIPNKYKSLFLFSVSSKVLSSNCPALYSYFYFVLVEESCSDVPWCLLFLILFFSSCL